MTRYIDIVSFHDGLRGPAGVPAECVEHDGTRPLREGETRLTVEEYRSQAAAWRLAYEAWAKERGADEPSADETAKSPRRIRSLAFLDRLPIERQAEIVAAARVLATQGQPMVDLLLTRLCAAIELDLDDLRVVHGVATLREAKLIDEAEAAALLADPRGDEMP